MNTHKFVGSFITCLKCCKAPSDPVHIISAQAMGLIENISRAKQPEIQTFNGQPVILYNASNHEILPTCPGHCCPQCKSTWNHTYDCGQVDTHGLCFNCAQQTAAMINRPSHIEQMVTKRLTPLETKQLELDHEQFVVLNIVKDPITGLDNPDWAEKLADHIKDIERTIDKYRVKLSGANRARASKEVQELNKITPEEREQFLRDASRGRVPKVREEKPKDTPLQGTKREKAILSLLKMLNKTDTPENRKFIISDMLGED